MSNIIRRMLTESVVPLTDILGQFNATREV